MISVLILAAGQSSRMRGGDKLLELVDGQACLAVLTQRALATGFDVRVVLPALDHPRAQAASGARRVVARDANLGMAHSLRAGLGDVPDQTRAVIILPGDMPDIQTQDLQTVANAHYDSQKGIVQATTADGKPGHPILFAARYFEAMSHLSGDRGAWAIIDANRDDWGTVALQDGRARRDLDTPEDWAAWRAEQKQSK
ncbi:MAG: NTP transferase domain-containing protein [Sedimentitalea sp.]